MPTSRDLQLDEYEISNARYRELLYKCRQYPESKYKRDACYGISAMTLSDMPRGGAVTSAIERQAERAMKYAALVELVENTAKKAVEDDVGLYEPLVLNVAYGTPYYQMPVPCGKNQFTKLRRRFFYLLDKSTT